MSRTGRRPGTPETRDAILAIARRRFAVRGYDATSLRDIATEAAVDPALIIHYFRSKEALFAAATGLPDGISELLGDLTALPLPEFAQALVRGYLELIDSDGSRNAILALVRSAVSNDNAAATLREFLTAQFLPVIGGFTRHPDAQLRASLVAAQLIGIATQRHVIRLEPLARASPGEIVALVAPAIEQYLRLAPFADRGAHSAVPSTMTWSFSTRTGYTRSGGWPVREQPVASSNTCWCSGQITTSASARPSAIGPPACGQAADTARRLPSRSRNTAIISPPAAYALPSPTGSSATGPSRYSAVVLVIPAAPWPAPGAAVSAAAPSGTGPA